MPEKLLIPTKYAERLEEILEKVWDLPDNLWEIFWDFSLKQMEVTLSKLQEDLKDAKKEET